MFSLIVIVFLITGELISSLWIHKYKDKVKKILLFSDCCKKNSEGKEVRQKGIFWQEEIERKIGKRIKVNFFLFF